MLVPTETYSTCDFPAGDPNPLCSLWIRLLINKDIKGKVLRTFLHFHSLCVRTGT